MLQVVIRPLPPVRIAALRHVGPYGPPIAEFWSRYFVPWRIAEGLPLAPCYGVALDDPTETPPAQCRFDAGTEVPDGYQPGQPGRLVDLPGGLYATARFHGSPSDIGPAWAWLFSQWLPDSGYRLDRRPCFERQGLEDLTHLPGPPFRCELCLPIIPR